MRQHLIILCAAAVVVVVLGEPAPPLLLSLAHDVNPWQQSMWITELTVGTPPIQLTLEVLWDCDETLCLYRHYGDWSRDYVHLHTNSTGITRGVELVHMGMHSFRMPIMVMDAMMGMRWPSAICAQCDGVMCMGRGSFWWDRWPEISFSSTRIQSGRHHLLTNHPDLLTVPCRSDWEIGAHHHHPSLCRTQGSASISPYLARRRIESEFARGAHGLRRRANASERNEHVPPAEEEEQSGRDHRRSGMNRSASARAAAHAAEHIQQALLAPLVPWQPVDINVQLSDRFLRLPLNMYEVIAVGRRRDPQIPEQWPIVDIMFDRTWLGDEQVTSVQLTPQEYLDHWLARSGGTVPMLMIAPSESNRTVTIGAHMLQRYVLHRQHGELLMRAHRAGQHISYVGVMLIVVVLWVLMRQHLLAIENLSTATGGRYEMIIAPLCTLVWLMPDTYEVVADVDGRLLAFFAGVVFLFAVPLHLMCLFWRPATNRAPAPGMVTSPLFSLHVLRVFSNRIVLGTALWLLMVARQGDGVATAMSAFVHVYIVGEFFRVTVLLWFAHWSAQNEGGPTRWERWIFVHFSAEDLPGRARIAAASRHPHGGTEGGGSLNFSMPTAILTGGGAEDIAQGREEYAAKLDTLEHRILAVTESLYGHTGFGKSGGTETAAAAAAETKKKTAVEAAGPAVVVVGSRAAHVFFDVIASVLLPLLGLVHGWVSHVYFIFPVAELMLADYRPVLPFILLVFYGMAAASVLLWLTALMRLHTGRRVRELLLLSSAKKKK